MHTNRQGDDRGKTGKKSERRLYRKGGLAPGNEGRGGDGRGNGKENGNGKRAATGGHGKEHSSNDRRAVVVSPAPPPAVGKSRSKWSTAKRWHRNRSHATATARRAADVRRQADLQSGDAHCCCPVT